MRTAQADRAHLPSFFSLLIFLIFIRDSAVIADTFNTVPVTWTATPFNGRSIPLHVKGPCNNVWQSQGNHTAPANLVWPRLWDFNHDIKGWYASVRVDNTPYMLLGNINIPNITLASQQSIVITPTRSSFLLVAGSISVNMTFLSPIEPDDPVKMSSPFSYFYFTFASTDGKPHNVELYSDISGEWISGDTGLNMTWSGTDDGTLTLLSAKLFEPQPFQINGETCQDGAINWAMLSSQQTSWQIAGANDMRTQFANGTALTNSEDPNFRVISDNTFTTFAIAVNVGSVTTTTDPVVYAIGLVRDAAVTYTTPNGQLTELSPLYGSVYGSTSDLVKAVLNNFTDSLQAAETLDAKLAGLGGQVSGSYSDLLTLSTRQAFGAVDLTVGSSDGEVRAFARDIGNVGSGGVNAVDVIYAAMPAYVTLWPDLLGYLLTPLLEFQDSAQYTLPFAAQDIGNAYPNATGNTNTHNSQIEQTANMLILSLAHAQYTGNGTLLAQYYNLLNKWATFLVSNVLAPAPQETASLSDGINGANQTNLALKGIIGIAAMAKISGFAGDSKNQSFYQNTAEQYAQQWTDLAIKTNFVTLEYGSDDSGLVYNLYADKLLQTNIVNSTVYDLQSAHYASQFSTTPFGLPLAFSNPTMARSDWSMFAAAVASDSVRESFIDGIHSYLSTTLAGLGDVPFAVVYNPSTANELVTATDTGGMASFAQGAVFAPLALNVTTKQVTFPNGLLGSDSTQGQKKSNAGAVAGGVIGGLIAFALCTSAFVFFYRRRRLAKKGQYNRESRFEPWKITSGGGEVMIEPFPEDVETGASSNTGPTPNEPKLYPNEKSAFNRPGGLPSHPRAGGAGYTPPYPYPSSGSVSSESHSRSQSQSRRESSWRDGRGTVGTAYDMTDEDRGNATFSPTSTDPSSGLVSTSTSSGGPRTYVSPYENGRRGSAPTRRRGNGDSVSTTTRDVDVLATMTEVAELRREVERIRMAQEQGGGGGPDSSESEFGASIGMPPPPSYEDEVVQQSRRRAAPLPQVPSSVSSGLVDAELTSVRSQK